MRGHRTTWDQTVAEAFAKVRVNENGCWIFGGFRIPGGYGQVGRNRLMHRVAWELVNGPIPDGLTLDHTCHDPVECHPADVYDCPHRACCNPGHLTPATIAANTMRGGGFGPKNAAKTHCSKGHEFTEANTYYRPDRFGRMCRDCRDQAMLRYRARQRELVAA